jgi:hypothetical protein
MVRYLDTMFSINSALIIQAVRVENIVDNRIAKHYYIIKREKRGIKDIGLIS